LLADWSSVCLVIWLAGFVFCWMVRRPPGSLPGPYASCFGAWLAGWLAGWLDGWLAGWMAGWHGCLGRSGEV